MHGTAGDGGLTGRHDYFGSSLACLGDLDGDDELELVVGLPGNSLCICACVLRRF